MTRGKAAPKDSLTTVGRGDHLVLWYRTEETRARAVSVFLSAGIKEGALLCIILPLRELEALEKALIAEDFPVDKVLNEGRLMLFASEEFLPCRKGECRKLTEFLLRLKENAEVRQHGLRIVGRIAPVLFEAGDLDGAIMIERLADAGLGDAKLLCLYDARTLEDMPDGYAEHIDNLHTHALGETDDGQIELTASPGRRKSTSRR